MVFVAACIYGSYFAVQAFVGDVFPVPFTLLVFFLSLPIGNSRRRGERRRGEEGGKRGKERGKEEGGRRRKGEEGGRGKGKERERKRVRKHPK